jgi:trimethylguanosine synthase
VDSDIYNLQTMEPYSLAALHSAFTTVATHLVLYLPRNSDVKQLVKYAGKDHKLIATQYCMRGASKALCVYFGEFALD